jgi:MFS family permease
MLAWLRDLTSRERRTMLACWGGWTLDGFDQQLYSYVVPTVIAVWGMSTGAAGTIGTVTVVTSSFGGWFAGALADRFGRVRMLQIAILWYSVFTFLCGFAQNFEQLFILRGLHGLGFGGEWATGAVLMGEVIRDKYRGRGVGFVQTGAAVGPGLAALVYAGLFAILPEAIAWRTLFWVGILPALFVLWIRRSIRESEGAALYRNERVGFIFQYYDLLPQLTALENILVLMLPKRRSDPGRAQELLDAVGLGDRGRHRPSELSGGEQQRVAIARALVNDPALILADEPVGNLDDENACKIAKLLASACRERGKTLILVTHNRNLIHPVDHVFDMRAGSLTSIEIVFAS